jgi:two-component system sensor kinase FixL
MEFETKGNNYELNAVPLVDNNDKINQILVVERNTTVQKRAEKEMVNALNQERALNELKSRFVSMASHEFRTPLSTILSSISLVDRYNEGLNEEKISKHIGRIKGSVQNLNGILNDFLSLDRLEEGNVQTSPVEFDISELVADLIDEMEATLKKDQSVNVSFDCDTKMIYEDAKIIKNILINLTSNAIKYSNEGQDIILDVQLKEKVLTLTVSDKGIGIPVDEQHHLFARFFRARNVTNIEGTGLGLNIVGKYVALLNGKIAFDSKPGKGTTFIVTLPLKEKV